MDKLSMCIIQNKIADRLVNELKGTTNPEELIDKVTKISIEETEKYMNSKKEIK